MPVRGSAARPAGGVGGADPADDDYGVPIAAVARHRGELLDTPVYDGAYARLPNRLQTLQAAVLRSSSFAGGWAN